jgi:uncharacterized protein YceK
MYNKFKIKYKGHLMFKLFRTLLIFLFLIVLTGCGTTTKKEESSSSGSGQKQETPSENQNDPTPDNPGTTDNTTQNQKSIYSCTNSITSENSFSDSFVQNEHNDIDWSVSPYNPLTVNDIETAFNTARAQDSTVTAPMVLPPQNIWDNYSSSEKILYLLNKERCDRGIRPFEGIDPAISSVSLSYATYLKDNPDKYAASPHTADGRSPWERMAQDAGVEVNQNADFFQYGENIASLSIASSEDYPNVYENEARAVYGWMYEDKVQEYGHRNFMLATGLVENSGIQNEEGLIGVGVVQRQYKEGNFFWTQKIIVMDGFDPRSSWDNNLASAQRISLYH